MINYFLSQFKFIIMKKLAMLSLASILFIGIISCGPSKKEKESAMEKARMDSFDAAMEAQRQADAIATMEDSTSDKSKPELAKEVNLHTNTPKDRKFIKTAGIKFKVNNVWKVTERIEDIAAKYDGYVTYSNLQNRQDNYASRRVSRDSILICRQIVVENNIELKIPNENIDSFIRELNKFILFLDYRVIKLDDATYSYLLAQKQTETLQNYQQRQTTHIDTKKGKLKETTNAEENLLDTRLKTDELSLKKQEYEHEFKYCTLTLNIYQKPLIVRETIANFNYISSYKPNFFHRIGDSIIKGWWMLEEIIVFLVNIWSVLLIVAIVIIFFRWVFKKNNIIDKTS
jgi:hypothetical protein